ncbi:MAG: benzoate-CoA ligase family protein [Armatimonadota bacterium]
MSLLDIPERYNASTLLDRNLGRGLAHKVCIRWQDQEVTYGEVYRRVCGFARALRALGVRREERVLLVLDDSPAFPVAFLGAIRTGAVPIPTNPLLRSDDYAYFLLDSGARAVVADPPLLDVVREVCSALAEPPLVLASRPAGEGQPHLEELVQAYAGDLPPADTHRDDMAFWLYSSGSTGRPKGVVHLQHDILYTCETYARHVLRITQEDVTFSASKLFHAYGLGNNLSFPYWAGASTVLRSGRPTPEGVLETIQRYRPTLFFAVPTLYNAILNHPNCGRYDLSGVRLCVSAAEALPAEIFHRWKERFGLVILDGVGSTEMLHIYCSNTPEALKPGSSGRPVPGYELKIVSPDTGQPVAPGEVGDLYVKGDSELALYWHQHEKTKRSLHGGWFYTGDRYRVDEEGFYWYEGRSDDMIKVGGLWVSPVEIENTLIEHPAVQEAAVVGIPVEGLTRIRAFVVLKPGRAPSEALAQELQEWCKERLARYRYPHYVTFTEDLPKTVTGKIQRFKLRESGPPVASQVG